MTGRDDAATPEDPLISVATPEDHLISVATWNIEFGRKVDKAIAMVHSSRHLSAVDIWLLQEMDDEATESFARQLGFNHVYGFRDRHRQTGRPFGNAIVARWSLTGLDTTHLPQPRVLSGTPRLVVGATVDVPGVGPVDAYSVHAELPLMGPRFRRRHFDTAARSVLGQRPAVIGGDFNTATRLGHRQLHAAMARYGAEPAFAPEVPTLVRFGRALSLDHVFVRGLTAIDYGSPGIGPASDHAPVWVQVRTRGSQGTGQPAR